MRSIPLGRSAPAFLVAMLSALMTLFVGRVAQASPFASCITNDNGTIRFVINESGGNVTVVYDDGTTNANFNGVTTGVSVAAGSYSFPIGTHSGYQIIVHKDGGGNPFQISTDSSSTSKTAPYTYFPSGRGIDANKNPKIGYLFGRTYVGNTQNRNNSGNIRRWGIYALTPDFRTVLGIGGVTTNIPGGQFVGAFAPDAYYGNTASPWHIRVGEDNNVYAACYGTSGGGVLQFGPSFEYTNVLFNPFGENQGIEAQTHSDTMGVYTTGSTADGNLTVWTFDSTLPAPDTNGLTYPYPPYENTNHPTLGVGGPMGVGAYGPTINGDYNMILRYDVGAGDPAHYGLMNVWTNNGGDGYAVGDVLAIVGGTTASSNYVNSGSVTSLVYVAAIAGTNTTGPISILFIATNGDYTIPPTSPVTVTPVTGTGSGATLNVFYPQIIWSARPNFAEGVGLPGFPDSQVGDVALGPDGKIFATFRRWNYSDGDLQGFDPTLPGTPRVYDSLKYDLAGNVIDTFGGLGAGFDSSYGGVAFSPDGKYVGVLGGRGDVTIALLTNGVPDDASITILTNAPNNANYARGLCWDAADNIYVISSATAELRSWSLGVSSTCISSNDVTCTNGTFSLALPKVTASLAVINPNASQNYINSTPPGTPIAGVFRIQLTTNNLTAPLAVKIGLTGTAKNGTHYNINTTNDNTGIKITATTVTFPAGTFSKGGNYYADITITPTANPLSTNTLTVNLTLNTSSDYLRTPPVVGTVYIQNTGPQLLVLTPIAGFNTMYRGTTNDYAAFIITRLGDTNGPENLAGSVSPRSYTLTNFDYTGTATYPADYTARAQVWSPYGTPIDGDFGITINPGDTVITNLIGNPVYHGDIYSTPTNETIIVSMTNAAPVSGDNTNLLSAEGLPYTIVADNAASLTIIDNRVGPEQVVWSDPLNDAADSVNWTLTFSATNTVADKVYVQPSYPNNVPFDGIHDYDVNFGFDPSTETYGAVPPSPTMIASNWTHVLRMTVNKNNTLAPAGVNLYPHQTFGGNYALRFNMYLSLMYEAINNQYIGSLPREFAAFGMDHYGTNCNWRIASPINDRPNNSGNDRTNQDGVWFTVDAATGSQTPADYDAFQGRLPLPNSGVSDTVDNTGPAWRGVFKSPPFPSQLPYYFDPKRVGGEPVNNWVDVSMEVTGQTNCSMWINGSRILSMPITNGLSAGQVMLGYLDPVGNNSDASAFVYYSNLRVVELSPYISTQAGLSGTGDTNLIVAQGSSFTLAASASFGTAPITNTWYKGTGSFNALPGTPLEALQTNIAAASTMNDTFTQTVASLADGTNYMNVFSDAAGSITSTIVSVEVVMTPASQSVVEGDLTTLSTSFAGASAPTAFQWYFNTSSNFATATALANNTHIAGATTANLNLTNVVAADAGYYWVAVTNAAGGVVTEAGVLTVGPGAPQNVVITPGSQQFLWGAPVTLTASAGGTAPFTYQWKKDGLDLTDGGNVSGATSSSLSLAAITTADAGSYTVGVTNGLGGAVGGPSTVTVFIPAPKLAGVSFSGGNVVLNFSSTNSFDTSSAFTLQSSPDLSSGIWTNTPGTYTGSGGTFQVSAPQPPGTPQMFYRLVHAN